jgi:predicted nucleic acid-binding protein
MPFVVDASLAAAWFLPDEQNEAADQLLLYLRASSGLAPSLFWFETRNLFLMAERRGRLKPGEALLSMAQLRGLPIEDAGSVGDHLVLEVANRCGLSGYDASYLALASDRKLPFGTCDRRLAQAALAEKVELLGPLAAT